MAKKFNFGPGFSMDEIPYWVGFIVGVVICGVTLRAMDVNRLVIMIGCMVTGVVVGMVFDYAWQTMQKPPPPPGQGPPQGPPGDKGGW